MTDPAPVSDRSIDLFVDATRLSLRQWIEEVNSKFKADFFVTLAARHTSTTTISDRAGNESTNLIFEGAITKRWLGVLGRKIGYISVSVGKSAESGTIYCDVSDKSSIQPLGDLFDIHDPAKTASWVAPITGKPFERVMEEEMKAFGLIRDHSAPRPPMPPAAASAFHPERR